MNYPGTFADPLYVVPFAQLAAAACIDLLEAGFMTKYLAILVGPEQGWMTTQRFLAKLDENLQKKAG